MSRPALDNLCQALGAGEQCWVGWLREATALCSSSCDAVLVLAVAALRRPGRMGSFLQLLEEGFAGDRGATPGVDLESGSSWAAAALQSHLRSPSLWRHGPRTHVTASASTGATGGPPKLSHGSCSVELLPIDLCVSIEFWSASCCPFEASGGFHQLALCVSLLFALNFLACAGWSSSPVQPRTHARLSETQCQCLRHVWSAVGDFLSGPGLEFSVADLREELLTLRIGYDGEIVSKRRNLIADLVVPIWPAPGKAAVAEVIGFVSEELQDDLSNPANCLLPRDQWPDFPPRSFVHASPSEWYGIVKAGLERGILGEVHKDAIFRDKRGEMVLNGAMGWTSGRIALKVRSVSSDSSVCSLLLMRS